MATKVHIQSRQQTKSYFHIISLDRFEFGSIVDDTVSSSRNELEPVLHQVKLKYLVRGVKEIRGAKTRKARKKRTGRAGQVLYQGTQRIQTSGGGVILLASIPLRAMRCDSPVYLQWVTRSCQ